MYIRTKDLVVNLLARTLHVSGKPVDLTNKEFDLLAFFLESSGDAFSKEQILQHVWHTNHRTDASVKKLVSELRKKIGDSVDEPVYIKTLGREGYQWVAAIETVHADHDGYEVIKPVLLSANGNKSKILMLFIALIFSILAATGAFVYKAGDKNPETAFGNLYLEKIELPTKHIYESVRSPDNNFLAYSELTGNGYNRDLVIYDLKKNQIHARLKNASPGAWSPTSSDIVYIDGSNGNCQFKIYSISENESHSLNKCGNYGHQPSAFWANNQDEVYQFYSEQHDSQIKLFKTNIKSGVTESILSSKKIGYGLYFGTFGEDKNTVYILESVNFQRTSILEYKIAEGTLKTIGDFPYTLTSIAFDGDGIVYRNKYNGLDKLDLTNGKTTNILSSQLIALRDVYLDTTGELLVIAGNPFHLQLIKYSPNDLSYSFITQGHKDQYPLYKNGKLYHSSNRTLSLQIYQHENGLSKKLTDFTMKLSPPISYDVDEHDNFIIASPTGLFTNNKMIRSSGQAVHYHDGVIYFSDSIENRFEIFRMELATGKVVRITYNGGYSAKVINGEVFFTKPNLRGLWKLDVQGKEILFNKEFPRVTSSMEWFYTSNEVWAADPETSFLYRLDLRNNKITKSKRKLAGQTIAGDGKDLYGVEGVLGNMELYNLKLK